MRKSFLIKAQESIVWKQNFTRIYKVLKEENNITIVLIERLQSYKLCRLFILPNKLFQNENQILYTQTSMRLTGNLNFPIKCLHLILIVTYNNFNKRCNLHHFYEKFNNVKEALSLKLGDLLSII